MVHVSLQASIILLVCPCMSTSHTLLQICAIVLASAAVARLMAM